MIRLKKKQVNWVAGNSNISANRLFKFRRAASFSEVSIFVSNPVLPGDFVIIVNLLKGTVKEKWKGVQAETWESQELNDTHETSICLSLEIGIKLCQNYTKTYICKIYVRLTRPELPPMAVTYTCHVIQLETHDNNPCHWLEFLWHVPDA